MLQICIFSNMHHSWAINANTTKLEMFFMDLKRNSSLFCRRTIHCKYLRTDCDHIRYFSVQIATQRSKFGQLLTGRLLAVRALDCFRIYNVEFRICCETIVVNKTLLSCNIYKHYICCVFRTLSVSSILVIGVHNGAFCILFIITTTKKYATNVYRGLQGD